MEVIHMVKPVKKEIEVFVTFDNKEFLTEQEALNYEKHLKTKFVLVRYQPDLTETGNLTKTGIIELVGTNGYEKEHAMDICYRKFGSQIAYVQGCAITRNWSVDKILTLAEYSSLEGRIKMDLIERWEMPSGSKR